VASKARPVLSAIKRSQDATSPSPSSMLASFVGVCHAGRATSQEPSSWEKLERTIQTEMEAIQKEGDQLINEIMEGSSGNESEEINSGVHTCYGYKNLGDPPEHCLALAPPHLWVHALHTEEKLFFCKAFPDQTTLQVRSKDCRVKIKEKENRAITFI